MALTIHTGMLLMASRRPTYEMIRGVYRSMRLHRGICGLIGVVSLVTLCAGTGYADSAVYRVERDGKIEYTTKPTHPEAKPAQLPKLGRWKLETPEIINHTCGAHGGINCARGADKDGSVVCFDGYTDSIQRFAFECTAAKLDVLEVSPLDRHGGFTVTVRNNKSVPAKKTQLTFKPQRMEPGFTLVGPDEIEGFGVGEFRFNPRGGHPGRQQPKISQLIVSCENCG